MQTIHEWLEQTRERPTMHCSNRGRKSLLLLNTFIEGLKSGNSFDPDPPYGGFNLWLGCRGFRSSFAVESLAEELGDEAAFTRFFEFWDEYRQCRREYLLRAVLQDHEGNFRTLGADGEFEAPQRPLELIISQFAPSNAYAVTEVYTDYFAGSGRSPLHSGKPNE